jgi:hypothetical protein
VVILDSRLGIHNPQTIKKSYGEFDVTIKFLSQKKSS